MQLDLADDNLLLSARSRLIAFSLFYYRTSTLHFIVDYLLMLPRLTTFSLALSAFLNNPEPELCPLKSGEAKARIEEEREAESSKNHRESQSTIVHRCQPQLHPRSPPDDSRRKIEKKKAGKVLYFL